MPRESYLHLSGFSILQVLCVDGMGTQNDELCSIVISCCMIVTHILEHYVRISSSDKPFNPKN